MKKYRKGLASVLTVALFAGLLSGCGGSSSQDADKDTDVKETQEAQEIEETQETKETELNFRMDETVLLDDENVTVTVTDFNQNGDFGPTFTFQLENKTDSNLYYTLSDVSINDVMSDPLWGETLSAGEKVTSELYWTPQELSAIGINYIEDIDAILWIYDADDYKNEDTYEDAVSWKVTHDATDVPSAVEAEFGGGIEDMHIIDTDDITATIKDYSMQGEWGPTLTFYLANNTDSDVLFFMDSVVVNEDMELATYWNEDVKAGKVSYSSCHWWQEDIDEYQIDEIKTVSFTFSVLDYSTWEPLAKVNLKISLEGTGEILERNE